MRSERHARPQLRRQRMLGMQTLVAVAATGAQSVASKQRRRRESGSLSALLQPSHRCPSVAWTQMAPRRQRCCRRHRRRASLR